MKGIRTYSYCYEGTLEINIISNYNSHLRFWGTMPAPCIVNHKFHCNYTGLFEIIVGVLTTCHTQYTWDRSILFFYLIKQHSKFLLHTLQVLYMCTLCDSTNINTIIEFVSTQNAFSLPFATILVNCAPSGEMHDYCTPHIIKENWEFLDPSVQLHTAISSVFCMTSCWNPDSHF